MYLGRLVTLFSVILLITASVSAKTVTVDGNSCKTTPLSPCNLNSVFGTLAGALQTTDDIVINGAKGAIYTIAKPITCKAMTITNGVVTLASNLNLAGLLHVGPNAQLIIDSATSIANCNSIKVEGTLLVKSGIANIAALDLTGALRLEGGQLNVNNLACATTCLPNYVGGIIKHTGQTVYNALPIVSGTCKFLVDGTATLNKGIHCLDKCVLGGLTKSITNIYGDSKILNAVNLDSSAKFIVNKGTCALNGLNGATESSLAVVDGILNLNGVSNVPSVSLNGAGSLNVNSNLLCKNIDVNANAKLNLLNSGLLKVSTKADVNANVNLANTAQLVIDSKATANLLGGMKCSDNSVFKVLDNANVNIAKDCSFNQPISVGPKSIVNLANGVTTCNKGMNTDTTSIINIDKATCNINHDTNLGTINLNTAANLNINGGKSIISGPFKCGKGSSTSITNADVQIKAKTDCDSVLNLNTKAKLNLDGLTNLNAGLKCSDSSSILNIAGQVNVNAASDLKAATNINAGGILNLNGAATHTCGNLNTDVKSTLNIGKGCGLKIDGTANLNGINNLVDAAHVIVNGNTNILSPLKCSGTQPSNLSVTKTGKCNFSAPSTVNGVVDNAGTMIIDSNTAFNTLNNAGNMVVNKPCEITSQRFTQNDANSVINLNAGGSINAGKTLDLVKGTVNGVGALKCGTCNLGNNINANLNIDGDIVLQPTCNLVAKVNQATGTVVPMIVGTGKCVMNGVADLSALAMQTGKTAATSVVRLISAPNVSGNMSVKPMVGHVWNMVIPDCKCACEFHHE